MQTNDPINPKLKAGLRRLLAEIKRRRTPKRRRVRLYLWGCVPGMWN